MAPKISILFAKGLEISLKYTKNGFVGSFEGHLRKNSGTQSDELMANVTNYSESTRKMFQVGNTGVAGSH